MEMTSTQGFKGTVRVTSYKGHNRIRLDNEGPNYRDFSFRKDGRWVQVAGKDTLPLTGEQRELFESQGYAWIEGEA